MKIHTLVPLIVVPPLLIFIAKFIPGSSGRPLLTGTILIVEAIIIGGALGIHENHEIRDTP